MLIDFRRSPPASAPTFINGTAVEIVSQYKYLGTVLDDKLTFEANTDYICKKAKLFFLRKLRDFNVDRSLLKMFHLSFIESVLTFAMICWYDNLSMVNKNRLGSIVKLCQKIIGINLHNLDNVYQVRAIQRAKVILADLLHPLHAEFRLLPTGSWFTFSKRAKSNRYLRSFVPSAVGCLNKL